MNSARYEWQKQATHINTPKKLMCHAVVHVKLKETLEIHERLRSPKGPGPNGPQPLNFSCIANISFSFT